MIGLPVEEIAEKHGVSSGAVEIVLRCHHYLVPLRQKIRFYKKRVQHRKALSFCISRHKAKSRSQIKQGVSRSYHWLYKHDSSWLYQELPPAIDRKDRYKRND
jgi:hypothetical protein